MELSYQVNINENVSYEEIEKFLVRILHFEKYKSAYDNTFYKYYKDEDYKFYSGIYAKIVNYYNEITAVEIWIGGNDHSFYDLEYLNYCYKQFREYFRDRIIIEDDDIIELSEYVGPIRDASESGCYIAFDVFQNNFGKISAYSLLKSFPNFPAPSIEYWKNEHHPEIISNNLVVPFIISSIESYFRDTFLAILKYSENRNIFYKKYGAKIIDEFDRINNAEISINEAICNFISFQNIKFVCENFKLLDKKIDLFGFLKRNTYQNMDGYEFLEYLIDIRHSIIHQSHFDNHLSDKVLQSIMESVSEIISNFYTHLIKIYIWQELE